MATLAEWTAGARLRTLPAAAAPVLVGTGAAIQAGGWDDPGYRTVLALLALGVALALQVGVNFANDYSDGVRGTDLDRVGPLRITAAGLASPAHVKYAAFASFGVGAALGLVLVLLTGYFWLLGVGVVAIAAAWFYTGGAHPYGYIGLGEVGVFVFFGLVAVLGSTYIQLGRVTWPAVAGAVGVGLFACALLMVNNLRDIPTDALVGKRTLAVRIGDRRARRVYVAMVALPIVLGVTCAFAAPWSLLVLLLALPVALLSITVLLGARGIALVPVLAGTGLVELGYGMLLGLGLSL